MVDDDTISAFTVEMNKVNNQDWWLRYLQHTISTLNVEINKVNNQDWWLRVSGTHYISTQCGNQ